MHAVVFKHTKELKRIEVRGRFDFEDRFLETLVPPHPSREYKEHHPDSHGVRVFLHPVNQEFEARPYLEFVKLTQNETLFHVMQEGRPTGFTVVLG
jgi:hypothetical protein